MNSQRYRTHGAAMITVLAFTIIASLVTGAVGLYAVSSFSRATVEGDYASAVNVADAGMNALIRKLSLDPTDSSLVHQANNPLTGTIAGVGSYSVYVQDYNTGGNWVAPNDMRLIATGTVNGVARAIEARGVRKSIFDEYAIFMDEGGTLGGTGQSSGSTTIIGDVGVNGSVTFNGSTGTGAIQGELTLNGGATTNTTGTNVVVSADRVQLPTVAEMATILFPGGGLTWLRTNNNNAKIMRLKSSDLSLASIASINGVTLAQTDLANLSSLFDSAGITASHTIFEEPPTNQFTAWSSTNASDGPTATTRRFASATEGILGRPTYFIPPGDYYFTGLDFDGGAQGASKAAWVLMTHLGRIRIWVDDPTNSLAIGNQNQVTDKLNIVAIFTDSSPSKFRLFYNKCGFLDIGANSQFNGGFYAVKPECTKGPQMDFSGGASIYGSVIASLVKLGGGSSITFPNDGGGADPTDYSLWFGFKDGWKERPIANGNPIFVDGSSK